MWAFLYTFLMVVAGPLVLRVLSAIGIGTVAYIGIDSVMDYVKAEVYAKLYELPQAMLNIAGLLDLDVAINIVLSALVARTIMAGVIGGVKRATRIEQPWRTPGAGGAGGTFGA